MSQAARQRANLERAAQLEALLHAAFCDAAHPPDLEFGCFAVVLGPPRSVFVGEALLRIDTGVLRFARLEEHMRCVLECCAISAGSCAKLVRVAHAHQA